MTPTTETPANQTSPPVAGFVSTARPFEDRRSRDASAPGVERRQFAASPSSDNPDVNELAAAIDNYKLANRRRFVTVDELHGIITSLGYRR